ncbi:hypothetical protein M885DRAFT_525530 [Pelagophyceae sp. CCMP2097]|nr:hypothetical protein M885DRAFT_525530 [Pelagophyceae sp. CCMP2097]
MVRILSDGTIDRDGRGAVAARGGVAGRRWPLALGAAALAFAATSRPPESALSAGAWFLGPAVRWHVSLGVVAVAYVDAGLGAQRGGLYVGAFGRWFGVGAFGRLLGVDAAPVRRWLDGEVDDVACLTVLCVAIFALHVFVSAHRLRCHFLASEANVRAGRLWCLLLAAVSHEDALHLATNMLSLANVGPPARVRLGRQLFWALVCGGALASSAASVLLHKLFSRHFVPKAGAPHIRAPPRRPARRIAPTARVTRLWHRSKRAAPLASFARCSRSKLPCTQSRAYCSAASSSLRRT